MSCLSGSVRSGIRTARDLYHSGPGPPYGPGHARPGTRAAQAGWPRTCTGPNRRLRQGTGKGRCSLNTDAWFSNYAWFFNCRAAHGPYGLGPYGPGRARDAARHPHGLPGKGRTARDPHGLGRVRHRTAWERHGSASPAPCRTRAGSESASSAWYRWSPGFFNSPLVVL